MVWWNDVLQDIYTYAELIGKIDVHTTMAVFIHEHAWCLPTLTQTGDLHIIA